MSQCGRTFYWGRIDKFIHVKAGLLTTCVDRPERATMYQIGDHNGAFSMFWGHAAKIDGNCRENHLPSCPFCRRRNVKQYLAASAHLVQDTIISVSSSGQPPDRHDHHDDHGENGDNALDVLVGSRLIPGESRQLSSCLEGKCTAWDVLDPRFNFDLPAGFPLKFDTTAGAPIAPEG